MSRSTSSSAIAMAGILAVTAVAAWVWRATLVHARRMQLPPESWEQVKQQYPLPEAMTSVASLSVEAAQELLHINPFSPQRRPLSEPSQTSGASAGSAEGPAAPQAPAFLYKGRVFMGDQQRAIVEEGRIHKTYFLQVGQTVAGFKVLDIGQKQVVLSNLATQEELVVSLASSAAPTKEAATSP